ncbi:hypothetical protein M8818_004822 [Zalaria obscura]|uniref:Uncharacterized protein n=1 Tax=Zalaria obscura TaxID=2024903 RepID=A0ACC3SCF7_9PEZI
MHGTVDSQSRLRPSVGGRRALLAVAIDKGKSQPANATTRDMRPHARFSATRQRVETKDPYVNAPYVNPNPNPSPTRQEPSRLHSTYSETPGCSRAEIELINTLSQYFCTEIQNEKRKRARRASLIPSWPGSEVSQQT